MVPAAYPQNVFVEQGIISLPGPTVFCSGLATLRSLPVDDCHMKVLSMFKEACALGL